MVSRGYLTAVLVSPQVYAAIECPILVSHHQKDSLHAHAIGTCSVQHRKACSAPALIGEGTVDLEAIMRLIVG